MKIEDIPAGESWACRFKVTTFVDKETGLAKKVSRLILGGSLVR